MSGIPINKTNTQFRKYEGYLYILPAFIIIAVFGIYPLFYTLFISLHKWRIKKNAFIGLENYRQIFGEGAGFVLVLGAVLLIGCSLLFREQVMKRTRNRFITEHRLRFIWQNARTHWLLHVGFLTAGGMLMIFALPVLYRAGDQNMLDSLRVTIWYSMGSVPLQLAGGVYIAWLLNRKFTGKQFYRTALLLPYIVPVVAGAAVFERLFSARHESFANQLLIDLGMAPQEWLFESEGIFRILFGAGGALSPAGIIGEYWNTWAEGPSLALVSILFFSWWVYIGYYALIFTNGLSQIPKVLYEVAKVDGAPRHAVFFHVVLPLLRPTTYFLTLLGIIGTFKNFTHIWVLRNNIIANAADPLSIYIFTIFFGRSRFGYASALSLILLCIVLLLTVFQNRIMQRNSYNE